MSDLLSPHQPATPDVLRTVRLPAALLDEVKEVAQSFGTTNTDTLIALINEGLAAAKQRKQ